MRTYTVTRKKGSKLGEVFYSVGTVTFRFKKGSTTFKSVPELVAVRVSTDYPSEFNVKLNSETVEPTELFELDSSIGEVGKLAAGHLNVSIKEEN